MNRLAKALAAVLLIHSYCFCRPAVAETPATQPKIEFMRFIDDPQGGGVLQTKIATFRNDKGVVVHLAGAVHVGEKSYYQGLDKTFAGYDALLYEMVKPKGAGVPAPGEKSASAISIFQHWLKNVLDLDFQLDDINYSAANFVHADLDWETFTQLQTDRGESIMGIMLQSMMQQWARQAAGQGPQREITLIDLLVAMRSPDRARQFKLLLGRQFGDIEDQMSGLDGPNGSVLITERNKKALAVLQETIASGKTNIGIFYGAGHMNDMVKRLSAMGFKETGEPEWRTAWDMTILPGDPSTRPATLPTTGPTEKSKAGDVEDAAP